MPKIVKITAREGSNFKLRDNLQGNSHLPHLPVFMVESLLTLVAHQKKFSVSLLGFFSSSKMASFVHFLAIFSTPRIFLYLKGNWHSTTSASQVCVSSAVTKYAIFIGQFLEYESYLPLEKQLSEHLTHGFSNDSYSVPLRSDIAAVQKYMSSGSRLSFSHLSHASPPWQPQMAASFSHLVKKLGDTDPN